MSEDYDLVYQTLSANRSGTMFNMCERLVPVLCRWIDYNGVAFSIELLEWGRTFSDFWG